MFSALRGTEARQAVIGMQASPMQGAYKTLPIPWPVPPAWRPAGRQWQRGRKTSQPGGTVSFIAVSLGKMASVLSGTWMERKENAIGRSNENAVQAKSIKNPKENIAALTAAKFISICGNLVKYVPL